MRVFATADLHADFRANRDLVDDLSSTEYVDDVLIAAGDIGHRMDLIAAVLEALRERFSRVFYVPGNHDLWVREGEGDSLERFGELLECCARTDIDTAPARIAALHVVPLFSWYEPALDGGGEVPRRWADRRHCRWPDHLSSPAEYFASLNEPYLRALTDATTGQAGLTLTCSHFLPRRDLLPPDRFLRYPELPKVAGSPRIERQLRQAGSDIHVFGHSHIRVDEIIDGVRYVQHSLAYPRERREPRPVIKQVV